VLGDDEKEIESAYTEKSRADYILGMHSVFNYHSSSRILYGNSCWESSSTSLL
jgi:hypothetical protein